MLKVILLEFCTLILLQVKVFDFFIGDSKNMFFLHAAHSSYQGPEHAHMSGPGSHYLQVQGPLQQSHSPHLQSSTNLTRHITPP